MLTNSARRLLAGFGVVGAIVAATATPSFAEAATAKLGIYFSDTTIAAGTAGKVDYPLITSSEPVVLHDVKVRYDYTALAGKVKLTGDGYSPDCAPQSTNVLVCTESELEIGEWGSAGLFSVLIAPTDAAKDGDSGLLKVSLEATGIAGVSHDAKVRIGEGVDLAAGPDKKVSAAPGAAFQAPLTVQNAGGTIAKGANVIFFNDYAIQAGKHYSNCTYAGNELRTCHFDEAMEPGTSYTAPLAYQAGKDTYAPSTAAGEIIWMTPAEFEDFDAYVSELGGSIGEPGGDGVLSLTATTTMGAKERAIQADTDPDNNHSLLELAVTGKNGADLFAIGGTGTGKAGDVVTAKVGFGNNGPAVLDANRGGSAVTVFTVAVPTGTTVVRQPENCDLLEPGDPDWEPAGKPTEPTYLCFGDSFVGVKETQMTEFGLRIDKVVSNATGLVKINAKCACDGGFDADLNPANDVAKLVINPAATGNGGEGGGTLPVTGSSTGIIAGVGGLLLAAGVVGFVLARRRRTRFVA